MTMTRQAEQMASSWSRCVYKTGNWSILFCFSPSIRLSCFLPWWMYCNLQAAALFYDRALCRGRKLQHTLLFIYITTSRKRRRRRESSTTTTSFRLPGSLKGRLVRRGNVRFPNNLTTVSSYFSYFYFNELLPAPTTACCAPSWS